MASLSCDHARDLFSEVFEESLAPDLTETFDRHLHGCRRCQADFTEFRSAIAALQSWEIERVPDTFHATLDSRLARHSVRPRRRVAALVIAAAALALLCFGWPWLQRITGGAPLDLLAAVVETHSDLESRPPEPAPAERQGFDTPTPVVADGTTAPSPLLESASPPAPTTVAAARPIELNIDTRPLADLLAVMWTSLRAAATAAPAQPVAEATDERTDVPSATTAAAGPVAVGPVAVGPSAPAPTLTAPSVTSSDEPSAPVVVVRGSGYVQIRTSGAPYEVIPALLALVAERDPELRSAAEEHLRLMHDSFMENPELAAQLTPLPEPPRSRSLAALHDPDETARGSLHRWERWWNDNRQLVDR